MSEPNPAEQLQPTAADGFVPDDAVAFEAPELPVQAPTRRRRAVFAAVAIVVAVGLVAAAWPAGLVSTPSVHAANTDSVTILAGAPSSIDPARHGDLGSARYVAQLYESLTAVDANLQIRPALAESWAVTDDGTRVTFTLRPNLTFSDGSPLRAQAVVDSWRRLFYPRDPSPLASLIADVKGARDLLNGASSDVATLGVEAPDDRTVVVSLERGGADLPAIVSSAPFAVVPEGTASAEIIPIPGAGVGSGAYTIAQISEDRWKLKANPNYWAGEPAIGTVYMVTTLNGASPVDEFAAGNLDVTSVGYYDAGWIAYDRELGPSLRSDPSLSVTYYGFDATRAPFDNVLVRQAFAMAVDWRRLAALDEPGSSLPATSLVPKGIPGTPSGDFLPAYDPAKARELLAQAGYASGADVPPISFIASGGGYDEPIVAQWRQNLGVTINYASMDFDAYQTRLANDPPGIWSLSWVADYPGPNDFLGVLLGSGSTANQGAWSSEAFDAAVAEATSAASPDAAMAAYAKAMGIIRDEVPVVPVAYGTSYSLVRDGLTGAYDNGQGIIRLAGLAWGTGQ